MECSLLSLIACFSLSGFYVDGGLSYQDAEPAYVQRYDFVYSNQNSVIETGYRERIVSDDRSPYGRLAVGYEIQFSRAFLLALEASHVSSVDTSDDDGINAIGLRMRWYPFQK